MIGDTTAVKGSVLASVLYFDDFGSVQRHFDKLDVYLDTVVLMQSLGFIGPDLQVASREMIGLTRDLGGRLLCFRDTLKEMDGVLTYAARLIRSGRARSEPIWGATEYLVKAGMTASDVELMAARLEDDLRAISVTVRDRPAHVIELTIDEDAFAKALKSTVRYRSDEPLRHDLDAITSIHRLRHGEAFAKIESSRAIFVTTNTPLAQATTTFFRNEYRTATFAPLCMPAHQFATLAWLKMPLKAPDLPTKYVLADAIAGLNPPESRWRDYVAEISKLEKLGTVSANDCYLLRYSSAAKEALMGITMGGSRAYLEGSVPEILERVRAAERREAEQMAARERQLRIEAEAKASASLEAAQATNEANLRAATTAADAQRSRHAAQRAHRLARYEQIGSRIARVARALVIAAFAILAAIPLYGASPLQPFGPLPESFSNNPLVLLALLIVGVIGLILTITGQGLARAIGPLETRLGSAISRRLMTTFEGPDVDDTDGDAS